MQTYLCLFFDRLCWVKCHVLCPWWHNVPIWHLKCTSSFITCNICNVLFSVYFCISHLPQCLAPVPLCSGWKVTTVEGLGAKVFHFLNISSNLVVFVDILFNVQPNYHPIQLELASNGGTQCGFCRFSNQLVVNDIPTSCTVIFILLPISLPAPAWWCSCTRSCRSTRTPPWSRSTTSWTATSAGGLHNAYSTLLHIPTCKEREGYSGT